MRIWKKIRRAGALCLAGAVLLSQTGTVCLQAAESGAGQSAGMSAETQAAEASASSVPTEPESGSILSSETGSTFAPEPVQTESAPPEGSARLGEDPDSDVTQGTPGQTETQMAPGTKPDSAPPMETEAGSEGLSEAETGAGALPGTEPDSAPAPGAEQAPGGAEDPAGTDESGAEDPARTNESEAGDSARTDEGESGDSMPPETESEEAGETEDFTERAAEEALANALVQGFDPSVLSPGESVTFYASLGGGDGSGILRAAVTAVTVTMASEPYRYEDYGFGTWHTFKYTVTFNGSTATAYCIQPSVPSAGSGSGYTMTKLKGAKNLAKVCYYGTRASGDHGFFAERYPDFSGGQRFLITHMAAAYANGSSDAFYGANETAKGLALELYNYCVAQPDIPEVEMEFSDDDVTAYVEGKVQRTKEIKFKADTLQSVTFKLPDGVKLHNVTDGTTSGAGADVEVTGGTRFYLTAPLTQAEDVASSWSKRMKGSITRDFSAYKITAGVGLQELALVFGEGVEDEKYITFTVHWLQKGSVTVRKVDARTGKGLAGAVFGVYRDQGCQELLAQMPATDANGESSAEIGVSEGTVYLKELTAPPGYERSAEVYPANVKPGTAAEVQVPNTEKRCGLTIYKEGEVLTGAEVTESGTVFRYEMRRLPGAVFDVYAGADIISASGDTICRAGSPVAQNLTTGPDGAVSLENLYYGTYTVQETRAPQDYVCQSEPKTVILSESAAQGTAAFVSTVFRNERREAEITVRKADGETGNPLRGGVYGLFAGSDIRNADGTVIVNRDTLIEQAVTGGDGSVRCRTDLPVGYSYYIKELRAPDNYVRDSEDVYTFSFESEDGGEAKTSFSYTFENRRVNARIRLKKRDAETGTAQGDATLEHAVYGLYAREDIVHPDGATGVLYHAGDQVAALTTDGNGEASVEDLYLGEYYIRELTPSNGYLLNPEEYDVTCAFTDDLTLTVEAECDAQETVMKQPFQIIKIADNGKDDADKLQGAGFMAFLVSALRKNADGTYDLESALPVVIGADGAREIFTDEFGYAVSIPLPFGEYIVRETTVPQGYAPVKDFIVRITENKPTEPQPWRVLLDKEFSAKLRIVKNDDETHRAVLEAGTEFRVYDIDEERYVEQTTNYPVEAVHSSYFTDEEGSLILPEKLPMGHYWIEEVTAPDGYTAGSQTIEFEVGSGMAYRTDRAGEAVVEVAAENHPVKGELRVMKTGEVLDGYQKDFLYKEQPLAGAVFEVYAAEDIYTADCQTGDFGERLLEYAAGSRIAELTTGADGEAVLRDLPLGIYRVEEKTAPEGFVRGKEAQNVRFVYVDQDTPVVTERAVQVNERQHAELSVLKKDARTGEPLAGAVFGLYAAEDIKAGDRVVVSADTKLAEAVTDGDGRAVFAQDLPFGKYYILELEAPAGYLLSGERKELEFSYEDPETEVIRLEAVFENEPTVVKITKSDLVTGAELKGASLCVLDSDGQIVDSWISKRGKPHTILGLHIGGTYTLREELAPRGYLRAEEVTFKVENTGKTQKVEMQDDRAEGRVVVEKTDADTGAPMQGVEFTLCGEDGSVLETLVTDRNGRAESAVYPIAVFKKGVFRRELRYVLRETGTLDGYLLDGEEHEISFAYEDDETPVIEYRLELTNKRAETGPGDSTAPRTGDETDPTLPVCAAAVSVMAFLLLALRKKRNKVLS